MASELSKLIDDQLHDDDGGIFTLDEDERAPLRAVIGGFDGVTHRTAGEERVRKGEGEAPGTAR